MKKTHHIWTALLISLTLLGCKDNSTGPEIPESPSEKQFVWDAMNYWYYWQQEVPDLADDRFSDQQEFYKFLNGYSGPNAVFNALLAPQDDFSFFIDDYEEFQDSQQGISESFGYEFGLVQFSNSNNIFGYIQYVLPEGPANQAGLVRGNLFTKVDGTQLTVNNYQDLLFGTTNYQLSLATIEDGSISETGETVDLEAITLQENPIFIDSVYTEGSTSIGYLMYNAFQRNSHEQLNEVFGNFQSEGIGELVVDLRYNPGGAGITSQALGSLISGLGDSDEFATYSYNSKRAPEWNRTVTFRNKVSTDDGEGEITLNKLSLDRVYVLTGRGTASASELLINSLKPYIDVVVIGRQTVGKDEGSYTLYDAPAPYLEEEKANLNHKYAIQPIIIKLVNRNGQAYSTGFVPNHEVSELDNLEDLPPLGDKSDPLLAKAIELITGQPPAKIARVSTLPLNIEIVSNSKNLSKYGNQLYLEPPKLAQ